MLKHTQGMFGSTEEFPPDLYVTAVSFSVVSWVKWERQFTVLTDTDVRPQLNALSIIPGANSLGQ